jgi:hypothetical protein
VNYRLAAAGVPPSPPIAGRLLRATIIAVTTACADGSDSDQYAGTPTAVDDTVLVFPSGERFVSGLYAVTYLGRLDETGGAPVLILGGVECGACDAPPSVLLRAPAEGRVRAFNQTLGWFPYPGRIRNYPDTTVIVRETRLFWGRCAEDAEPGVVEYGAELAGGRKVRESVRSIQIRGGALVEDDPGSAGVQRMLEETLELVAKGACREVPARDRYVDP